MDEGVAFERVDWAIDHCLEHFSLNAPLVVAGDPEILWSGPPLTARALEGGRWAVVDLPAGSVLLVGADADQEGPWLTVMETSDGPLDSVTLQPNVWSDVATRAIEAALSLPSGRLVVGAPEIVAAWGPAVEPDAGLAVQTKTGWDEPDPTYIGLITVVKVQEGVTCPIEVAAAKDGAFHSLTIMFPRPDWTPPGIPAPR